MSENIYYIVEEFDPTFDYNGGKVISVMPEVSYEMARRGVSYSILEDYYDEKELRANEEKYFYDQLKWFESIDVFLSKNISFVAKHKLLLARFYYRRLKYFFDSLAIQAFIVHSVLKSLPSAKVFYFVSSENVAENNNLLESYGRSDKETYFSRLFQKFAMLYPHIKFELREVTAACGLDSRSHGGRAAVSSFDLIPKRIKGALRFGHRYFRYKKWKKWFGDNRVKEKTGFLFLNTGDDRTDIPLKSLMWAGMPVYYRMPDGIYRMDQLIETKVLDFSDQWEDELQVKKECQTAANLIVSQSELLDFVRDACSADVGEFVVPYLRQFISQICPGMILNYFRFKKMFSGNSISFVFANDGNEPVNASALLAAQQSGMVQSVCIQHGMKVYEDKVWEMTDLDPFDYCLTTDGFSEEDFRRVSGRPYLNACEILQSPHYLTEIKKTRSSSKKRSNNKIKILYLPTKFGAHRRCFNNMMIPLLTFYEFQKALMDCLGRRNDCEVVFKKAKSDRKWMDRSIIPYIQDRHYNNIRIREGTMLEFLDWADAVLLDRPTTAHFEASYLGKPVLDLNHVFMGSSISQLAEKYFGKTIRIFSKNEQALSFLNEFLNSDFKEYIRPVPVIRADIVRMFLSRLGRKPKKSKYMNCESVLLGDNVSDSLRKVGDE
ncbi:MAG: hypothetical protein HZC17_06640 [Candidatus Omnitrophica bacterium]|nr:hypothetical protein [Candidatus Omnitrophota bacterium]